MHQVLSNHHADFNGYYWMHQNGLKERKQLSFDYFDYEKLLIMYEIE